MTQLQPNPTSAAQTAHNASASSDAQPIIQFDHVTKTFQRPGSKTLMRAVNDVSLDIYEGDIYGIIGYSGAGKSTLVRMINALEQPTDGTVTVLGTDISHMSESKLRPIRQRIGMIFQQFNLFATKTVAQNIAYPLKLDHWRQDYQDARVEELLEFVGLSEHANKYPSQLSGGQKQRVGIARALATNPKILLADEATSALDPETTAEVLALLKRVNEQFGITIVLITHQMSVIQQIANRVAVVSSGEIVERGNVYDVFAAPQQPVTKRFIATAIQGLPDEGRVNLLHEQHHGRLITMLIRQQGIVNEHNGTHIEASGANVSELIAHHGIQANIVYGGIDTVQGLAIGALTYELNATSAQEDEFIAHLREHNDVADFGTAANPRDYNEATAQAHLSAAIPADSASSTAQRAHAAAELTAQTSIDSIETEATRDDTIL